LQINFKFLFKYKITETGFFMVSKASERRMQVRMRKAYLIPEMVSAQQGMFILNSLSCKAHALEIAF